MPIVKCAALYFAFVFGAGFLLGIIRVVLVLPRVGERSAELLEAPLMLGIIVLAARWVARRFSSSPREVAWAGPLAAGFVLAADFLVGIGLRGMTPVEIVIGRDPVAGVVYYAMILVFAAMPAIVVPSVASGRSDESA